ncbi:MAG: hypothetical protein NZ693_06680 [Thermoflexales bacterium]|nr:hypothetical protein [Thermoflexales bacterium]
MPALVPLVAKRQYAGVGHALARAPLLALSGLGDQVAPIPAGERQQQRQHHLTHGRGEVELLAGAGEGDAILGEVFEYGQPVDHIAAEAVKFVADNDAEASSAGIGDHALELGAVCDVLGGLDLDVFSDDVVAAALAELAAAQLLLVKGVSVGLLLAGDTNVDCGWSLDLVHGSPPES